MHFPILLFVLVYTSLTAYASTVLPILQFDALQQKPLSSSSLEVWLENEERIALERLLANIAPHGKNAQTAVAGSVIASPSKVHPDYFYQCISSPNPSSKRIGSNV